MRADKSRPVPISYTWQNFLLRWDNMEDIIELGSSHVFFQHHMCVQLNQIFPPFFPLFSMGALSHFFSLKAACVILEFPHRVCCQSSFFNHDWEYFSCNMRWKINIVGGKSIWEIKDATHTKRKKTRGSVGFDKMLILTDFFSQRITMKPSSIWHDDSWKHSKRIPNYSIVLKWLHWLKFISKRTSTCFLQEK